MEETQIMQQSVVWAVLHSAWIGGHSDTLPLTRPHLRLGRGLDNDIVIEDPAISTHHLEIIARDGVIQVCDLGSRNGSRIGSQPLQPRQPATVGLGAKIMLAGRLELHLLAPDFAMPAVTMPDRVYLKARPMPGLVIWPRGGTLIHLALDDQPVQIGRGSENDVVVNHAAVSRQHAEIVRQPNGWLLRDRDSRHGLRLDDKRIKEKLLEPGDTLSAGAAHVTI